MNLIFGLLFFALTLALFFVYPFALIVSLNILFNLHIPYTFSTWIAAAIIYYSFARSNRSYNSTNKK